MRKIPEIMLLIAIVLPGIAWALAADPASTTWFDLDYLINLSSLLTVASFSVRGMLPLRSLAVGSQALAIPYFMLQPTPLWTPVAWTALFLVINVYHITRILLERRPVRMSVDEQTLYDLAFSNFRPRDFLKLVEAGQWRDSVAGQSILAAGEPMAQIVVSVGGSIDASRFGGVVARLAPGELVGAGIALTGQASPFDAEFATNGRHIVWPVDTINRFLEAHPDLARPFNDVVNRYLVAQINKLALIVPGGDGSDQH